MIIGYARTSTVDQEAGLEAQIRDLTAAGVGKLFNEQISSVATRPALTEALEFCREGDVFVVTKLDRLARSVANLFEIVGMLEKKGVTIRILAMGLDTSTATGKLMLTVLGGVAEFERSMMLERQKEGIAKAKAAGKYLGRKPTASLKAERVLELHAQGLSMRKIMYETGIALSTVHHIITNAADRSR